MARNLRVVFIIIVKVQFQLISATGINLVLVRLGVVGYLVDLRTQGVLLLRHDH